MDHGLWTMDRRGVIVSKTKSEKCPACGSTELAQDEDVLDTWFSSWLWPFSTLGWPKETPDLKKFYPTSVLSTGFDILTFWVSRMIVMGLHFMKDIPFKDVPIHALIRTETGEKMSKSLGNHVALEDPAAEMFGKIMSIGDDVMRTYYELLTSEAMPG